MSGARSRQVREIFGQTLELPPEARAGFLVEACAGDVDLLQEVQSLLAAHGACDNFLDASRLGPALGEIVSGETDPVVGRTLGRYRILELIGRGGMGAVYRAEQDRPRRQVAVKLIDRMFASAELVRRFEFEAEVLGRLQHPSIAQILEAGSTGQDGGDRPFFAMELVEGPPLDEYANAHRLPLRDRLVLMIHICDAVQHAHRSGVIHRDLKPANILVTGGGLPKILDFGVARISDPELRSGGVQTVVGSVIGTLPYMSPEQLQGRPEAVDTRSDVYALGVVCYELLTGRLPRELTGVSLVEAARAVSETKAPPLEAPGRSFPVDLKTVVAKALEEDPDRRYGSASDFAADLRRFLDHQPIAARPASGFYHVRKLMSRHRLASALLVTLVAVLAAFGIVMGVQANRIADERDRAELSADTAREVVEYLQELFVAPDPWVSPGAELSARDLLERGREKINQDLAGEPELRGRLLMILGKTYHGLGDQATAGELLAAAVQLVGASSGSDPAPKIESLRALSWWHRDQGAHEKAIATATQALAESEAGYGPESTEAATDLCYLGATLRDSGRHEEAAPLLERALKIREKILRPDHLDVGWSLFHLGWLRHLEERDGDADLLYRRSCAIMRAGFGAEDPNFAICLGDWAKVLASRGELNPAREKLERSLAIRNAVFPDGHPETANGRTDLGYLFWRMGDFDAAGEQYEAAFRMRQRLFGGTHAVTLASMRSLALVHERQGRPDEAERVCRERLALAREHHAPESEAVTGALYSLGALLVRSGKIEEAKAGHRELVSLLSIDVGNVRRAAGIRYSLVSLLAEPSEAEEALKLLQEIEAMLSHRPELNYPPRAGIAFYRGRSFLLLHRDREAEGPLHESLTAQLAEAGEDNRRVAESAWLLGLCRWRMGERAAGIVSMERAVGIFGRLQGERGPDHLLYRALLLAGDGGGQEARQVLEQALANGLNPAKIRLNVQLHPLASDPVFRGLLTELPAKG